MSSGLCCTRISEPSQNKLYVLVESEKKWRGDTLFNWHTTRDVATSDHSECTALKPLMQPCRTNCPGVEVIPEVSTGAASHRGSSLRQQGFQFGDQLGWSNWL